MTLRAGAGGYGGPGEKGGDRRSRTWKAAAAPDIRVTTARESSELDARTIAAGVPSRALMQRAGAAAAGEIAKLLRDGGGARRAVVVYAGSGNNGGDGWVVARALAASGVRVEVVAVGEARTDDARAERALAELESLVRVRSLEEYAAGIEVLDAAPADDAHQSATPPGAHAVVVDALLGTGARGAPRDSIARAIELVARERELGATVVALDVPSGVNADTGAAELAVRADITLAFGTVKRGLLAGRAAAGRIALLDVGLSSRPAASGPAAGASREAPGAACLVGDRWLRSVIPPLAADAHKGTRRKLVVVGGQPGMAGAPVLAARAAMRSGVGMVRLVVSPESLPVVQGSEPHALASAWPEPSARGWEALVAGWADVLLVGPGLGASSETRRTVELLLDTWRGPVVLDADALNAFAGAAATLGELLGGRPALLTPHALEFARLSSLDVRDVLDGRFDVGAALARTTGAAVLLKGVPTVVSAPDGRRFVSAAGTPALAAAGSGDLLGGIAATLLAQIGDPATAGAAAAWVHGRAAELAERRETGHGRRARGGRRAAGSSRGITLADVEESIAHVWSDRVPPPVYPVLAELPAVGAP